MCTKKIKLINHDCLPILMLLYTMLYIVLAYLTLFAALTNSVCLNNASSFLFLYNICFCQGYELSGEIALKNNHYYYVCIQNRHFNHYTNCSQLFTLMLFVCIMLLFCH